ncbi:MAG: type II toxin-antitoxin system VapC family toxin [Chloroflexi bacterium]|nr:type II toxin-antitoxin system VapC family toxin [Chloroflexota bacterium]
MLDASAAFAHWDEGDQWHERAVAGFMRIVSEKRPTYITDLAVAETHALMLSRLGTEKALLWLDSLGDMNVTFLTAEDHPTVSRLLNGNRAFKFSYADAFSSVIMERYGLRRIFTFDRHFQEYGWEIFPGPL